MSDMKKHPWPADQVAPRREAIARAIASLLTPEFAGLDDDATVQRLVEATETMMGPTAPGCMGENCDLPLALSPGVIQNIVVAALFLTGKPLGKAVPLASRALETVTRNYARKLGIIPGGGFVSGGFGGGGSGPMGQA